jgi:hypothetical protein
VAHFEECSAGVTVKCLHDIQILWCDNINAFNLDGEVTGDVSFPMGSKKFN